MPGFAAYAKEGVLGWIGRVKKIVKEDEIENASVLEVTFSDGKSCHSLSEIVEYSHPVS